MLLLMDEYVLKPHFIYLHVYVYPSSLPSFIYYLFIIFVYLFSFLLGPARLVF